MSTWAIIGILSSNLTVQAAINIYKIKHSELLIATKLRTKDLLKSGETFR